jgi:ubiquinol-cytochrome c reductase cytochrome b subunit
MPSGEFTEVHEPISAQKRWILTSHEQAPALELPATDARGVRRPGALKNKLRIRLSKAHAVAVPKVSAQDLKEIENH